MNHLLTRVILSILIFIIYILLLRDFGFFLIRSVNEFWFALGVWLNLRMNYLWLDHGLLARVGLGLEGGVRLKLALDEHALVRAARDVEIQLVNFVRLPIPRHRITRILNDSILLLRIIITRTHNVRTIFKSGLNHAVVFFYFNLCRGLIVLNHFACTRLSICPQSGSTIDVFRYLNLRRGRAIIILLGPLHVCGVIIVYLFSVRDILYVMIIIDLLNFFRPQLLKIKIPPKQPLNIIVLVPLEDLIDLILLNGIIFFPGLRLILFLIIVVIVLVLLVLLLAILIVLFMTIVVLVLLLMLRYHLLLLLLVIILWQPSQHLQFKPFFFHKKLILCNLLIDLCFEVLLFNIYESHIFIFLN